MTEDGRVEDVFELRKVFFFSNLSNIASFILSFFKFVIVIFENEPYIAVVH